MGTLWLMRFHLATLAMRGNQNKETIFARSNCDERRGPRRKLRLLSDSETVLLSLSFRGAARREN